MPNQSETPKLLWPETTVAAALHSRGEVISRHADHLPPPLRVQSLDEDLEPPGRAYVTPHGEFIAMRLPRMPWPVFPESMLLRQHSRRLAEPTQVRDAAWFAVRAATSYLRHIRTDYGWPTRLATFRPTSYCVSVNRRAPAHTDPHVLPLLALWNLSDLHTATVLHFPEFRLAIELLPGSFVLMNPHHVHLVWSPPFDEAERAADRWGGVRLTLFEDPRQRVLDDRERASAAGLVADDGR